jgi:MFS transporter, ACS family, D-galactonate transporter
VSTAAKPVPVGNASWANIVPISNARRWVIVGLLFVASFINYLDRATLSIALPLISLDLHLGPETKGLVLSSFFWCYAAMQIPIGWCADRYNLRWLYAGLFAVWSLACGLTSLAGSLGVLILLRMMLGIGESIYLPAGTKTMSILFHPRERGLPTGLFDCGSRLGMAVGAPLVALLVVNYGWRRMFALVGFTSIFWLVPWLATTPRKLQSARIKAPGQPSSHASEALLRIFSSRDLLGNCLGFFCFDYYWYLMVTWLPDYLVTVRHLTIMRAGMAASMPYFIFGVAQPIGGWIADRLIRYGWDETRTRKGIVTMGFLSGLLLIPAARAQTPSAAVALIMGASLVGLASGNLLVILQCCAPVAEVGTWTGILNGVGNVGGIIAPLATGILIKETGSYLPGFALAAFMLVAGVLAYQFVVGELKPHPVIEVVALDE